MKVSTLIKLNFLILGLGITIYIIYSLNTKGLNPGVQTLMGLKPTSTETMADVKRWKWCSTRVASVIRPEYFKISQEGNQWLRENGGTKVVDFLAVEKWFSSFCTVLVTPVKAVVDEAFATALMVKFIDGKVEVVRRHPNGTYFWNGQTFTSPAFDSALEALAQLPVQ